MNKKFNDSSLVSACLNYSRDYETYQSKNKHPNDESLTPKKEMYMSQYRLDYVAPKSAQGELAVDVRSGCKCPKCLGTTEPSIFKRHEFRPSSSYFVQSKFRPRPALNCRRRKQEFTSSNSLVNCFKDLKLTKPAPKRQISFASNKTFDIPRHRRPQPKIYVERYLNKHEPSSVSLQLNSELPSFVNSSCSSNIPNNRTNTVKEERATKKCPPSRAYLVQRCHPNVTCKHLCVMCEKCVNEVKKSSYRRVFYIDLLEQEDRAVIINKHKYKL